MQNNIFFGLKIDPFTIGGQSAVLLLSVVLGGLIGLERQWRGQAAGLRTHVLVSVGATLITLTSVAFGRGAGGGVADNPSRMAANVVVGIGFLGAGAIVREGMTVHGLTTAASIWTTAAIGMTLGVCPRMGELAVIATIIVLSTLIVLNWLEDTLKLKQRVRHLEIDVIPDKQGTERVFAFLAEQGIAVFSVASELGRASGRENDPVTRQLRMTVRLPANFHRARFDAALTSEVGVVSFQLE